MELYLVLVVILGAYLLIKKSITWAVQDYLDSFFEDPTGGIVPLDQKKDL